MPLSAARGDEAAHEVDAERPRADEEAAAERERERRLRARLERPDALPRALDAAPDGAVEDAAAGDLEVGEARRVEDLGDSGSSGHPPGRRPAQQAMSCHELAPSEPSADCRVACSTSVARRPGRNG